MVTLGSASTSAAHGAGCAEHAVLRPEHYLQPGFPAEEAGPSPLPGLLSRSEPSQLPAVGDPAMRSDTNQAPFVHDQLHARHEMRSAVCRGSSCLTRATALAGQFPTVLSGP